MYRINEVPSYIELTQKLQEIIDYYVLRGKKDLFGKMHVILPSFNKALVKSLVSELSQIKATTTEDNLHSYTSLVREIRHKILLLISEIPSGETALEIYLNNYEIYLKDCEYQSEILVDSKQAQDILFHPVWISGSDLDIEIKYVKKRDSFESWKTGEPIPELIGSEIRLNLTQIMH